ncbi:hypothetical protein SESBI_32897 [Sesbania bispinosa]|nr:hypothetical protein SESBI_32897 [Sesbania bispinosa]
MEFASLREFKDAILDYCVLNGREVFFERNDKVRVRLRCKQECNFLALVSKGKSNVTTGNSKRGRPPKGKKTAKQGNAQHELAGTEQGTAKNTPHPASVQEKPPETTSQSSNLYEHIGILRNAHNASMYIMVISGKQYDWLKVAKQLGFTNIQAYMTFMQKVDEAKKMCAPVIAAAGDCEGEGTQES